MSTTLLPILPRRDREFIAGIILLLLSLAVFCFPLFPKTSPTDLDPGRFVLNYLVVLVYLVLLLSAERLKKGRDGLASLFVLLTLSLVSCYSLNREINIFETSTDWWTVLLVICCCNYLTLPFFHRLARPLQLLVCGIAGVSLIAFSYLAIYLVPAYFVGALFFFALGLSLHIFVPLLFVIYTIVFIRRVGKGDRKLRTGFFTGLILALVIILQFTIRWQLAVRDIDSEYATGKGEASIGVAPGALPAWVHVAQHTQPGALTEKILKTGLVYTASSNWDFSWMPRRMFNEQRKHDPLIVIASFFSGGSTLTEEDKVKVLESMYDSRYQAQERLFSGDDLVTTSVSTHVQFWPKLHLSYTEENITVASQPTTQRWNNQQEAIYTFHIPEGAVVSSLSLWIKGVENKGMLASRGTADSAYKTIVGYYQRDPSVVNWQEGNTISVKVFPVTPEESRRFTIGITAPLEKDGQELRYRSIYFDGPSAAAATGSVHIQPMQPLTGFHQPDFFHPVNKSQELAYTGNYCPDWELRFRDEGVENATFHFNGKQYTTEAWQPSTEAVSIREVYLDLNKSWTQEEFNTVLAALPDSRIFAYRPDAGLIAVNSGNKDAVFRDLSTLQFSLFPLPLIKDKEGSLLISKSPATSPSIADLNGSGFSMQLQNSLLSAGRIRLFHLGARLSPYLKTLKESGAFRFESGDMTTLQCRLRDRKFAGNAVQEGEVVIDPAGVLIRRTDWPTTAAAYSSGATHAAETGEAPDHLLRLFAYRRIMLQLNGRFPNENPGRDSTTEDFLVRTAKEAHIVSPVSSLVVLEKQADYDQFNITQSKNSLQNAALQGKGAVPEPGEWALIIGVILTLVCIRLRGIKTKQL